MTPARVVWPVPPEPTAKVTDSPAAVPVVFWFKVGNVQLAKLPEVGVPKIGVTSVGLLANTFAPVPVSSVNSAARLALEGVAKKVAAPDAIPETPEEIGKPVAFVKVPEDGVPNAPPLTTGAPAEPTFTAKAVATPVPRPDTPVEIGRPVAFVSVAEDGVPSAGVTNVGLVANTNAPEPVSSVTAAAKLAEEGVPKNVATPVPKPETPVEIGSPVAFVKTPEAGVPNAGVVIVGEVRVALAIVGLVPNTLAPEPVEVVTPVPPDKTGSGEPRVKDAM